jgi:hypothetical protein
MKELLPKSPLTVKGMICLQTVLPIFTVKMPYAPGHLLYVTYAH